jgi:hypothetical protein
MQSSQQKRLCHATRCVSQCGDQSGQLPRRVNARSSSVEYLSVVPPGVVAHIAPPPGLQVSQLLGHLLQAHAGGTGAPDRAVSWMRAIGLGQDRRCARVGEQQAVRPRVVVLGVLLRHGKTSIQVALNHLLANGKKQTSDAEAGVRAVVCGCVWCVVRVSCAVCMCVKNRPPNLRHRPVGVAGEIMQKPPTVRPGLSALGMFRHNEVHQPGNQHGDATP